jgi:sodium transport system permease protein
VTASSEAYSMVSAMVNAVESSVVDVIKINMDEEKKFDLSTEEEMAGFLMAMIMPMLMVSFLFSGSMGVAPEAIAGEKERGTMATLLVTPINRAHIAIGKILSLSVIALLSGLSSFLGVIIALPKYMEGVMGDVDMQVYGMEEYSAVLVVILSTVLLIVSLISVISAYSKSVKEAGSFISPIMILSMLLGITTMFGVGDGQPVWVYLIPMYNSVQCFAAIFNFEINMLPIMITFGSNLLYAIVLGFILTKMFGSEKIMFKK